MACENGRCPPKRLKQWRKDIPCRHPNHNPPTHLYIPPGQTHEHTCPGCGEKIVVSGGPEVYL